MLVFCQCTLAIPPSKHTDIQMTATNIQKTSRIANARIYVEQAIAIMKTFRIIKHEQPKSLLPLVDDIVPLYAIMTKSHYVLMIIKQKIKPKFHVFIQCCYVLNALFLI